MNKNIFKIAAMIVGGCDRIICGCPTHSRLGTQIESAGRGRTKVG
jgi:hypothetical protein